MKNKNMKKEFKTKIELPKREIKFRAWNNWNKRMVYWEELKKDVDLVYLFNDAINPDKNSWQVMQFTGLKDKNGKEIYEGDILKIDRDCETNELVHESNESVYWKDGEFIVHRTRYPKDWEKYEVIGNIFENPNLLEK